MPELIRSSSQEWPDLPFDRWSDTVETLHLWTQVVGKVRLMCAPWTNHSWHVPLYVTARGLTTSLIPHSAGPFEMEFDLVEHKLNIRRADGAARAVQLEPKSVATFYSQVMHALGELDLDVSINTMPCEIPGATPFERDSFHQAYDADAVSRFRRVLILVDRIFKEFRAGFIGKCSPVHFFWGGFDLAVTRFSGKTAPPHPAGVPGMPDWVAREAYSHEVSSAGFWPGGNGVDASFYAYAYPEPEGFAQAVTDGPSYYSTDLGEYLLPYSEVRKASSPDEVILDFLQSTYEAAADLAGWPRAELEKDF